MSKNIRKYYLYYKEKRKIKRGTFFIDGNSIFVHMAFLIYILKFLISISLGKIQIMYDLKTFIIIIFTKSDLSYIFLATDY